MKARTLLICSLLAVLSIGSACGTNAGTTVVESVTGGGKVKSRQISLPSQVLGLQVKPEDISKQLIAAKRPYIDNVGLFSMRESDLVRATFQISRFNALARPESNDFRLSIIGLLGATRPQQIKVEDITVYATSGNEQSIFVWFDDEAFYVLTAHQEYEFPRTLLRRMIKLSEKTG